jgi:hypothetical protein
MMTKTEPPRILLTLHLEEMRDLAKLLQWMVFHTGALRSRAAHVEPVNEEARDRSARLLEAYSVAYMRAVLEQLGEPDLMRRLFVDSPDPAFAVNPESVSLSLARTAPWAAQPSRRARTRWGVRLRRPWAGGTPGT